MLTGQVTAVADGFRYARHHAKASKKNALAVRQVKIYFQSVPGISHQTNGIANAPYKLKIDGKDKTPAGARTDNQGIVTINIPANAKVELEIFGSIYELSYAPSLAAIECTKGVQQRLAMLGYHTGPADDIPGPLTERAILQFQADSIHLNHQFYCGGSKNGTLAIDGVTGPKPDKSETRAALQKLVKNYNGE